MILGDDKTLFASAAQTATISSDAQDSQSANGLIIYVKATAKTSSPSVVVSVDGLDPASGSWMQVAAFTAFTDVSSNVYILHPGELDADSPAEAKSAVLPRNYRVTLTHSNSNSITYSVGVSELT